MLYIICPTCGYFIGQKIYNYEQEKDKIENNHKLDLETKAKNITILLNNMKLRRYCCKMRVMTYTDIVHVLK